MTCQDDLIADRVKCILTYEGDSLDISINYTLLAINILVAILPLMRTYRSSSSSSSSSRRVTKNYWKAPLASLLFVSTFQIILCIYVGCSGVSIIWCAIGGWIFMDYVRGDVEQKQQPTQFQASILLVDIAAIVYYYIVASFITTLAHILAIVVLGIPLHYLCYPKADTASQLNNPSTAANNLTEEEKNHARMEAFLAEHSGAKGSVEECAWQLNEHPFVIGGGRVVYGGANGEEFFKGDTARIFKQRLKQEWDGSPRCGLGPYKQKKDSVDWIAKARKPKKHRKDLEQEMKANLNLKK